VRGGAERPLRWDGARTRTHHTLTGFIDMIKTCLLVALTLATTALLSACSADDAAKVPDAPPSNGNAPGAGGDKAGGVGGGGGGDAVKPADPAEQPKKPGEEKPAAVIGGCKDAFPASLPQVTSEFRVGSAPAPKGGDEKGTWHFTKVTAYLTATGGALLDEDASKAEGFGFAKFDGTRFQVASDITQTVSTKVTGRVVQATLVKVAGKYTRNDAGQMTFEPECQEMEPEQQEPPTNISFSRISDTEALFHQTNDTPIGAVTVVTTMKKAN
jgi:hypothetical protein